jgi:uncharacterized protein (DUF433 family)
MMKKLHNYIERNPEIMAGKPLIRGTRITVELILKKLSEGASMEQLLDMYPSLTLPSVLACLEYASNIIGNEELLEVS